MYIQLKWMLQHTRQLFVRCRSRSHTLPRYVHIHIRIPSWSAMIPQILLSRTCAFPSPTFCSILARPLIHLRLELRIPRLVLVIQPVPLTSPQLGQVQQFRAPDIVLRRNLIDGLAHFDAYISVCLLLFRFMRF